MRGGRLRVACGLLAAALAAAAPGRADVIRLRSGEAIQGRIVSQSAEKVIIATADGLRTVSGTEVASIEREEDPREVFGRRAAALGPRDAKGWYELGVWARERRLGKEAARCFRRVIRIDPDHAGARAALGYRRWGAGWRKAEEIERLRRELPEPKPPPPESPPPSTETPPSTESPPSTETAPKPGPGPGEASPAPEEPALHGRAKLEAIARRVEQKIQVRFRTTKVGGLLFHTTADPSSRSLRQAFAAVVETCRLVERVLGAGPAAIWPEGMLQVFHFQGRLQFFKFADRWDGRKPGPKLMSYFEPKGPHLALFGPPDPGMPRVLAGAMLGLRQGKPIEVIGWLRLGFTEWIAIAGDKADGANRRILAYRTAGRLLVRRDRNADVAMWMEDLELPPGASWARPLAYTMVDVLAAPPAPGRADRFAAFLALMRAAPPLRTPGIQGFDPVFEKYLEYQRGALRKVYRLEPETFAKLWEARVRPRR